MRRVAHATGVVALVVVVAGAGVVVGGVAATAPTAHAVAKSAPVGTNPFTVPVVARYLAGRVNDVTAAVYDVADGHTYTYRPGVREVTASMVKIDILAALLRQADLAHRTLTARERRLARSMVEASANHAATVLYNDVGQMPGITQFNDAIGFTQTKESWSWGEIATTPVDQLDLLRAICLPGSVLTPADQAYEQRLMEHVDPWERFGFGTGSPAAATVGLKDGYYPEKGTGWQINSAAYVRLGARYYLAVVMTSHNPDETYGIDTVTTVAHDIWRYLRP